MFPPEGRKIDADEDLCDVSKQDVVLSGVAELAKLQSQGYTYIKPRSDPSLRNSLKASQCPAAP